MAMISISHCKYNSKALRQHLLHPPIARMRPKLQKYTHWTVFWPFSLNSPLIQWSWYLYLIVNLILQPLDNICYTHTLQEWDLNYKYSVYTCWTVFWLFSLDSPLIQWPWYLYLIVNVILQPSINLCFILTLQ